MRIKQLTFLYKFLNFTEEGIALYVEVFIGDGNCDDHVESEDKICHEFGCQVDEILRGVVNGVF